MEKSEGLWTISECATFLGMEYQTILKKVNMGQIPFKIISKGKRKRCIRLVPSEIKKYYAIQ